MRFLVDTQLPRALAHRLREAGYEVEHVLDVGLGQSPDNGIWHHAAETGAAVITKDEDFAEWVLAGHRGPPVIWVRVGNCTNTELLASLLPAWPEVVEALGRGDQLIQVA